MFAQVIRCLHQNDEGQLLGLALLLNHKSTATPDALHSSARYSAGCYKADDVWVVETTKQLDLALKSLSATLP
ncbi:hypothetical protein EMIT043CA1_100133 [Pseudomonas brassicacearum]